MRQTENINSNYYIIIDVNGDSMKFKGDERFNLLQFRRCRYTNINSIKITITDPQNEIIASWFGDLYDLGEEENGNLDGIVDGAGFLIDDVLPSNTKAYDLMKENQGKKILRQVGSSLSGGANPKLEGYMIYLARSVAYFMGRCDAPIFTF